MRPIKGITVLSTPALVTIAALTLGGCASSGQTPVNLADMPKSGTMPLGAEAGPADGTYKPLTPAEAKKQFKDLQAKEYVVKKGDTLWSIANHFLKDPYYWPEIWYDNPQIKNPHRIYPGDHIGIMYIGGHPRIGVTLRPHIRYEALPPAVSAIPLDLIKPYLTYDRVMTAEQFEKAPYVLANRHDNIAIASGDVAYIRPRLNDSSDVWALVGKGKPLIDPNTGALLGYRAIYKGECKVMERGDPTVVRISKSEREVMKGDRAVPIEKEPFTADVQPRIPAVSIHAQVILLPDAITQIGSNQVLVLNAGSANGLVPGDMLRIKKPGRVVKDDMTQNKKELATTGLTHPHPNVMLPGYKIGSAMVFRTYDHVSYALVVKATESIHEGDLVQTPTQ